MLVSTLHRDKRKGCAPCLDHPWPRSLVSWSPSLVGFLPPKKRQRGRVDASNCLTKARMLPHLPLHPGLAGMYCSQERREYIMGFEGITVVKFNHL